MSTYKTYFVIENNTDMPVVKGSVYFSTYDYGAGATPEQIFSVVSSSDDTDGFKQVDGAINIPINGKSETVLQLFEGIGNNSKFILTLEFSDGNQIKFDVLVKLAYKTTKLNSVASVAKGLDSFEVSQFSVNYNDYGPNPDPNAWGTNTYRINQNVVPIAPADWMKYVDDSVPLCNINIPGTHDSAAINSVFSTPYACQKSSITDQLLSGIRALDVRIKVTGSYPGFWFVTCHGDFTLGIVEPLNEYQDFVSLLDECRDFLINHPNEALVMSLKIDDWNDQKNQTDVYSALLTLLGNYRILTPSSNHKSDIPILKNARGHIFLINRINTDLSLGAPLNITNNLIGYSSSANRNFEIYVQDKYEFGTDKSQNIQDKLNLTTSAFNMKKDDEVVWNFGSGVYKMTESADRLFGVYIHKELLNWFGQNDSSKRPTKLGWCFMDYADYEYESTDGLISFVDIFVSSNFNYENYPQKFSII